MSNALYVYGIIKNGFNLKYSGTGIDEKSVYTLKHGEFSALVHECEEKPYIPEDTNKLKRLIIAHNKILSKAMKNSGGVIPLPFNTIIKGGENSAGDNLKKWLGDNKARLEEVWSRIKNKREYGIRVYYEREKLIRQTSNSAEIKEIEKSIEGKSEGLSYLLKGKTNYKINEIVQNKVNRFKQKFYDDVKIVADEIKVNVSRSFINEEKDLLLSLSILVDECQVDKIKGVLEENKDFSFQVTGPFAPYSFVENEKT